MIKLFIKIFGKARIKQALFTKKEHTAIVNALFRRSEESRISVDDLNKRKKLLKYEKENEFDMEARCHDLAMKWYSNK